MSRKDFGAKPFSYQQPVWIIGTYDENGKKQQKEYHSKQRRTWGEINPVTRSVPSGKTYNRKKEKERISKEFRDGFGADSFLLVV